MPEVTCKLAQCLIRWFTSEYDTAQFRVSCRCACICRSFAQSSLDCVRTILADAVCSLPLLPIASKTIQDSFYDALSAVACPAAKEWADGLAVHSSNLTHCQRYGFGDFWDEGCAVLSLAVPFSKQRLVLKWKQKWIYNSGERGIGYEEAGPVLVVSTKGNSTRGFATCSLGTPCHTVGNCGPAYNGECGFHTWIINVDRPRLLEHLKSCERKATNNWMAELRNQEGMTSNQLCAERLAEVEAEIRMRDEQMQRKRELQDIYMQHSGQKLGRKKPNLDDLVPIWEEWRQIEINAQRVNELQHVLDQHRWSINMCQHRRTQHMHLVGMTGREEAPHVAVALCDAISRVIKICSAPREQANEQNCTYHVSAGQFFGAEAIIHEDESAQREIALKSWAARGGELAPTAPFCKTMYTQLVKDRGSCQKDSLVTQMTEEDVGADGLPMGIFG